MDDQQEQQGDGVPWPEEAERRKDKAAGGIAVVLGDGREWRVAAGGLDPTLDEVRDRWFDQSIIKRSVPVADARTAVYLALKANYGLENDEAARLVWGAEVEALVEAAQEVLVPSAGRRTYSAWARSALRSNGLDPAKVPASELAHVLRQLVATGRAEPRDEFTEADEYMGIRSGLMGSAG